MAAIARDRTGASLAFLAATVVASRLIEIAPLLLADALNSAYGPFVATNRDPHALCESAFDMKKKASDQRDTKSN